jgi:hypothetical protein
MYAGAKTPEHRAESHKIEKFEMPRRVYFLIKKEFASCHTLLMFFFLVFTVRQLKREKKVARSLIEIDDANCQQRKLYIFMGKFLQFGAIMIKQTLTGVFFNSRLSNMA